VLAPAAILIVNAFIVPNCAPGTGLLLYALGPVCSAIVAVCMAALAVGLAPRWPRLLFAVLALLSCVPAAWHFLNQPQVTAYGPLVGYIAGPLYEDVVEPDWTWLSYRALDIALWFALVAATHAGSAIPARLAMAVAATAVIVGTIRGPVDGWRVDVETISRALPLSVPVEIPTPAASGDQQQLRRAPSPAMVLHMASGAQHAWLRAEVTGDAREAYARLWSFFGGPADETIHIYLYPDVTTKHRMMGARNVEMAKPWLRQVHMVMPAPGGTILRHEMAHVFAGALGSPPFDVPMASGVVPNALLIEGVAVAAEWPRRADLDPHGQAQAMRRLELAPSLHSLFTPTGFFDHSGARAYTLAGSFVRWLVDQHGSDVLRGLYRDVDFQAATGVDLADLVTAWERFVDSEAAATLSDRDLARARARCERGGLFQRPCPVEIGRCRQRAHRAFMAGNARHERRLREQLMADLAPSLSDRPLGPDLILALAAARARAGDPAAAISAVDDVLEGRAATRLSRLRRAAALRARGDFHARAGQRIEALADWAGAAAEPIGDSALRGLLVRRHLSANEAGLRWLTDWMLLGRPTARWLDAVKALQPLADHDPVAGYLHARFSLFRDPTDGPIQRLRSVAPQLAQRWPPLAIEAWRLVAWRAARRGSCQVMNAALSTARQLGDESGDVWRADLRTTCSIRAANCRPER